MPDPFGTRRQGRLIITIDGPSGTGKSTTARALAKRLGLLYLDTGAMYRALAWKALERGICLEDGPALTALAEKSRVRLRSAGARTRVTIDGRDVTSRIRSPQVTRAASVAAAVPGVRRALVRQQRQVAARRGVVAEGRDTGTVVFPRADLKVYLTADSRERARRRYLELKKLGHPEPYARVFREISARDRRDRARRDSPLRAAKGALRIDNTRLLSPQVIDRILVSLHHSTRKKVR